MESKKQTLFSREEQIIAEAKDILKVKEYQEHPLHDEFSVLLKNYKKLSKQMSRLVKINDRQQAELQQSSEELKTTLSQLEEQHRQLQATQDQLVESEKMAALGLLVAGIAHEINTPFGAIHSSVHHISASLDSLSQLPRFINTLTPEKQNLFFDLLEADSIDTTTLSTREERKLRRELQQKLETMGVDDSRKLATELIQLGLLENLDPFSALFQDPVAQEIVRIASQWKQPRRGIENIAIAMERVSKLIFALKNYARQDLTGDHKTETDLRENVETVLTLYQNQFKQGVDVVRDFEEIPLLHCHADELIQVWTNLIHNALQAMKQKGKLVIKIYQEDQNIAVEFIDSGCGIPPETIDQIFKPFYTTKPPGEGTGLGLDIVKKIIDKHRGTIAVKSRPGCTNFMVCLPLDD
ncbi:MAG: GHKL domain-containing protein [SAR324 cluster bacterium]|nr:GHKL domain-containing protein [SAR324 cluster bacterium]